ncbi:MAG: PQQ-dependent sugar dehydrogenase, partial [Microcoleaceae cyanobacterium]
METIFESEVNLLFIDPSIPNYNSLIFSAKPGFEVVVLDTHQAGIDQISEVLLQKDNVESIHIISHGNTQGFKLGSTELTSSNLNEYKDGLTQWAESLTSEADILVYGCNLGQDQDLMSQLAQFTGADIAASDDLTGSSALGGNWAFEVTTGSIESELAFQADPLESYDGIFHEGHFHNDPVVPNDPNFTNELVLSGLVDPISMEWLPDGRALILSKLGTVYIADLEASVPTFSTYMTLPDINTASEKGLIDIALDPNFETNNHFYLYYTLGSNKQFQISRFEHQGNTGSLNSETVIWQDPTAAGPPDHYGGGLNFGPDGKLYLTLGDKGFSAPERAQNLSLFEGKVLRMNKDGTIPQDNPFVNTPGALPEIWAYGVRNPFRSDWDFQSNHLYIGDVGFDTWEEVNRISLNSGGANLGWNLHEGTSNGAPGLTDPIFQYQHAADNGAAIIGGTVYRGTMFPNEFQGAYFYADFVRNTMHYLKFGTNGNVIDADPSTSAVDSFNFEVDGPVKRPVFIEQGPDGALYYLNLSRPGGQPGEVRRITYNDPNSGNSPPIINEQSTTAVVDNGLTVDFTGVATDANGDSLTYTWDFGDSTQATGASVSHTYSSNGQYTPQLVVSDGQLEDRYTLPPIALGTPPTANIILRKQNGTLFEEGVDLFKAGDTILFEAQATDPDGSLVESSYNWDVQFIHDEHTHPEVNDFQGSSGTFNVTTTEHGFSADFQVGFEFLLTVTDSEGLTAIDSFSIFPKKVDIGFNDNLPGNFNFTLDGFARTSTDANPFDVDTAVNFQHGVTAPTNVQLGNVPYVFANWSAGASVVGTTPALTLSAPETNQTYIANYVIDDPNPDPEPPVAGNDAVEAVAGSQNNLLNVLANDSDPDPGDTISITGLGSNNVAAITTANGSAVSINGAGDRLIYTPGNGFTGNETFTYTIEDSTGRTSTASVLATVSAVSGPPVTNGLVLHLDGDNGVSTSGIDLVTGWTDQSGLGNNLTGVGDPSIIVDGLNGHNIISL